MIIQPGNQQTKDTNKQTREPIIKFQDHAWYTVYIHKLDYKTCIFLQWWLQLQPLYANLIT